MNIALISTMAGVPWGGSEELWADMAGVALGENHRLVICRKVWSTEPAKLRRLREQGAMVLPLPSPYSPWNMNRLKRMWQRFRQPFRRLLNYRPDVVCVSQGATYDVGWHPHLARFLRDLSVPYVLVSQYNNEGVVLDDRSRELASELFKRAYCIAFVAASNRTVAERQLARAIPNACVLKNPVNLKTVAAASWPDSSVVRMACVARLECRYKGQDLLLETLSGSEWAGNGWQLNLFGDGPDRQYLEDLVRYYQISDRVRFWGHVTDIWSVWRDNHLLLLPSRSEGTPLALVEAMLCGRAAVVTDVGGNAEMIEDGVNGFVAEAPSVRSFGGALKRAWAAKANWHAMGLKARSAVEFSHEQAPGRRLLELLSEAVHSSGI